MIQELLAEACGRWCSLCQPYDRSGESCAYPHTPVVFGKSAEPEQNKEIRLSLLAKECDKSAQALENRTLHFVMGSERVRLQFYLQEVYTVFRLTSREIY